MNPVITEKNQKSLEIIVLWLAGVASIATAAVLLSWYLPGSLPRGWPSGVWAGHAADTLEGIFYRPLTDKGYYGGSRYMPLFFLLHAWMTRLAGDVVTGAWMAEYFSALLFYSGALAFMRALGIRMRLALPLSLMMFATISFQLLLIELRGDLLAAGLNLWGVTCAALFLKRDDKKFLLAAILLWILAFSTKFATIHGAAALFLWLVIKGRYRESFALSGTMIVGAMLVAAAMIMASDGRVIESFSACGTGGGVWWYAFLAPLWWLIVSGLDPFFFGIMAVGGLCWLMLKKKEKWSFPMLYSLITFCWTIFIFSSLGTDNNHLMDLAVVSLAGIGLLWQRMRDRNEGRRVRKFLLTAILLFAIGAAYTSLPGMFSIRYFVGLAGKPTLEAAQSIRDFISKQGGSGAVLSENPFLPVAWSENPVLADAFGVRLIAASRPAVKTDFEQRIIEKKFRAIILEAEDFSGVADEDLHSILDRNSHLGGFRFYGGLHFQEGFWELLNTHYEPAWAKRPFVIYTPKPQE